MGHDTAQGNLPARGRITAFEPLDGVGRVQLEDGEVLRFGRSGCIGFNPSVGLSVWVTSAEPFPLGGRRAKALNLTGAPEVDPVVAAERSREARLAEETRQLRATHALEQKLRESLERKPSPWVLAGAEAAQLEATLRGLPLDRLVRRTPAADDRHLRLEDFTWMKRWMDGYEPWVDPCCLIFGGSDGDALASWMYPPLRASGLPAPVVFLFHEQDPSVSWVAESVDHFARMLKIAAEPGRARAREIDRARGVRHRLVAAGLDAANGLVAEGVQDDEERQLVRELVHAFDDAAPQAEALARLYAARGWTFALGSLEVQREKAAVRLEEKHSGPSGH